MALSEESIQALVWEITQAPLGDGRLTQRVGRMMEQLARGPDQSLPQALEDPSALEAAYRFLNNTNVTPEGLMTPHIEGTRLRAEQAGAVVVAHDTTEFRFGGEQRRQAIGRGRGKGAGFYGHFALCLSGQERHEPLGVIGLSLNHRAMQKKPKQTHAQRRDDPSNEARRWEHLCREVHERLGRALPCVHVMDREGDAYPLLQALSSQKISFVVRVCHDRRVKSKENSEGMLLEAICAQAPVLAKREIQVSARKRHAIPRVRTIHPPREGRMATLTLRSQRVQVPKPKGYTKGQGPEILSLHVVFVEEEHPPSPTEKVSWWLWTSEPVDTEEQVLRVVDLYRARWKIEEYFHALKTGCAYETRQLESRHALVNILCLFIPIAWKLFQLKSLCQSNPDQPAETVVDEESVEILRQLRCIRTKGPPTVTEVFAAIARLGGHRPQNGPPGWLVLTRGYQKLLMLKHGAFLYKTLTSQKEKDV